VEDLECVRGLLADICYVCELAGFGVCVTTAKQAFECSKCLRFTAKAWHQKGIGAEGAGHFSS
jgi:hypothetical protein